MARRLSLPDGLCLAIGWSHRLSRNAGLRNGDIVLQGEMAFHSDALRIGKGLFVHDDLCNVACKDMTKGILAYNMKARGKIKNGPHVDS